MKNVKRVLLIVSVLLFVYSVVEYKEWAMIVSGVMGMMGLLSIGVSDYVEMRGGNLKKI